MDASNCLSYFFREVGEIGSIPNVRKLSTNIVYRGNRTDETNKHRMIGIIDSNYALDRYGIKLRIAMDAKGHLHDNTYSGYIFGLKLISPECDSEFLPKDDSKKQKIPKEEKDWFRAVYEFFSARNKKISLLPENPDKPLDKDDYASVSSHLNLYTADLGDISSAEMLKLLRQTDRVINDQKARELFSYFDEHRRTTNALRSLNSDLEARIEGIIKQGGTVPQPVQRQSRDAANQAVKYTLARQYIEETLQGKKLKEGTYDQEGTLEVFSRYSFEESGFELELFGYNYNVFLKGGFPGTAKNSNEPVSGNQLKMDSEKAFYKFLLDQLGKKYGAKVENQGYQFELKDNVDVENMVRLLRATYTAFNDPNLRGMFFRNLRIQKSRDHLNKKRDEAKTSLEDRIKQIIEIE